MATSFNLNNVNIRATCKCKVEEVLKVKSKPVENIKVLILDLKVVKVRARLICSKSF